MTKPKTTYLCTSCDASYPAWQGHCTQCGEWNTIIRDTYSRTSPVRTPTPREYQQPAALQDSTNSDSKTQLPISSINTILDGGITAGQVVLFAGEPGIGKSTLLTQLCMNSEFPILYISGEESVSQIANRASRLTKLKNFENAQFSNEVELQGALQLISSKNYKLIIIDSIQTMYATSVSGYPGSMNQIRECANQLTTTAKESNVAVIMIGQITKEGDIAGPKILEHLVDTVLYFEGDKKNDTRILRVTKNRFGTTNEIALFAMQESGLQEVSEAESYFVQELSYEEGVAYTIYQEGSLSLLLEVQALCTHSVFAYPKRVSTGYDSRRLEILIAVLSKKLKLKLENYDVFVNVVGGIKVQDTSVDIAVAAAILSSVKNRPLPPKSCFVGELGLTGKVRMVHRLEQRTTKATKLGIQQIYCHKNLKHVSNLINLLS